MQDTLIKVHVTQVQREYLEFLVNRKLRDIEFKEQQKSTDRQWIHRVANITEYQELTALKRELQHAGT